MAGDKDQLASLAEALAGQGYPGMAIQYRLSRSGDAWFPATTLEDPDLQAAAADAVEDAMHAVAWLRSPAAAEHGFTARRIVLAGYSAGGITAATAAAADPDAIDGAVSLAGAAIEPDQLERGQPAPADDPRRRGRHRAGRPGPGNVRGGGRPGRHVHARGAPWCRPRAARSSSRGVVVDDLLAFLGRLG